VRSPIFFLPTYLISLVSACLVFSYVPSRLNARNGFSLFECSNKEIKYPIGFFPLPPPTNGLSNSLPLPFQGPPFPPMASAFRGNPLQLLVFPLRKQAEPYPPRDMIPAVSSIRFFFITEDALNVHFSFLPRWAMPLSLDVRFLFPARSWACFRCQIG